MKVTGTDGTYYTIEPNANLSGAVWNDDTVFPKGFEIPEKSET